MTLETNVSVKIVQISDPHLYENDSRLLHGINTYQSLRDVLMSIVGEEYPLDCLIVTGDLVQDESAEGYLRLRTMLAETGVTSYVIPGNHDSPELMTMLLSSQEEIGVRWVERLCIGSWQFLFLDSHVEGQVAGCLDEVSLGRLEHALAESNLPTAIFVHHPPLAVGSLWLDKIGLQNASEFLAVLERHSNVKVVVNGHIHQAFEFVDERGVSFYGSPSTCVQFKPKSDCFAVDDMKPGWRVFHFHDDGRVESTVRYL